MTKPRIFISHSERNFGPTDYAIRIIDLLGCIPVIAETQPKMSRPVRSLVQDSMDTCDAVIVILTPDIEDGDKKSPSQGPLVEIGQLQKHEKLKDRYVIIKEKTVTLGPMIPEARYSFEMGDYGPIAEAILIELSAMGLYSNYYSMEGSEYGLHELMKLINEINDLRRAGVLSKKNLKDMIPQTMNKFINNIIGGDA